MKIIGFVKIISRTRCSKTYLTKIGVIGRRVALITSPMTYLFGRSHMRVSGRKMKKKRCEGKRCEISGKLEMYKTGWFYKVSMKNCTIKPRTAPNKIKTKFKKFLFLIHNIMKKRFYYIGAEYLILPNRLGKLVEIYGKPVRKMLEYDPSKVDDKWGGVEYLHYVDGHVERKNFEGTIYCDYETANKVREENTLKQIGRVMQDKGYKIKEFDEKTARIEELEKENDELKSLPPVNIETIHNDGDIYPADDPRSKFYKEKFDEKLNENLTDGKKRGRATWEK